MTQKELIKQRNQIIDCLNKFDNYKGKLKKFEFIITSDKFQSVDTNDINNGVAVLTDVLNLSGGSVGDVDLYELLQIYFQMPEYRIKINETVKDAKNKQRATK